jgi:hypothetical protein
MAVIIFLQWGQYIENDVSVHVLVLGCEPFQWNDSHGVWYCDVYATL